MKNIKVYLTISLILTLSSLFLIISLDNILYWILFYINVTIFIILLIRQFYALNYIKNYPFSSYNESDPYFLDSGIFRFENNGFYVKNLSTQDFIMWNDINFIIAYNVIVFDSSTIFLEIGTDKGVFKFNEEMLGWYQLCNNIGLKLSNINDQWKIKLLYSPHKEDKIIVYNRSNLFSHNLT